MADRELTIRVTLDSSGAVKGLEAVGEKLDETKQKSGDASKEVGKADISLGKLASSALSTALSLAGITAAFAALISTMNHGADIADVDEGFQRLIDSTGQLSGNVLAELNEATGRTISNFNLQKAAIEAVRAGADPTEFVELTKAARALADQVGGSTEQEIQQLSKAFETGNVRALQNKLGIIDLEKAETELARQLGVTREELSKEGQVQAARTAILEAARKKTAEVGAVTADAGDNIARLTKVVTDAKDGFAKAIAQVESFNTVLQGLAGILETINFDRISKGIAGFLDFVIKSNNELKPFLFLLKQFSDETSSSGGASRGWEVITKGAENFTNATELAAKAVDEAKKANEEYAKALADFEKGELQRQIDALDDYEKKLLASATANEKLADALEDIEKEAKKAATAFNKELGNTIGEGLADVITTAFEGGDITGALSDLGGSIGGFLGEKAGAALGKSIGDSIGGALGETVGSVFGPIGEAVGAALGQAAIDGIVGLFGGRDAQGEIRDSLDRLFADLLKDNPAQVLIDGVLQTLTDLDFGRGSDIFETGTFDDLLASLPEKIQAGFVAAGTALSTFVEGGSTLIGQLAAVLTNNLGGSLNNLQILLKATGKTAEQLKESIVEAFLDGQLSALEAQTALQGIEQVMQKGIPDAVGDVIGAFNNLKAAGTEGGRVTVDALQDIGAEAQELGLQTIPQLLDHLVQTGQVSAEEVQNLQSALSAFGIDTLEELSNLSNETAIAIAANLEANNFPFAEVKEGIEEIRTELDNLPTDIRRNITFDVRVNVAEEDREILDQAGVSTPSEGTIGQSIP